MATIIATRHRRHWTLGEHNRLMFMLGSYSLPMIAKKLGRTPGAIERRLGDRGIAGGIRGVMVRSIGMSLPEVASALGVPHCRIHRWVKSGKLPAQKRKIQQRYLYVVDTDDLIAALESGLALASNLNPTGDWCEVVEEARRNLLTKHIGASEIARLLGWFDRIVETWRYRGKDFPDPALNLGTYHGESYYNRADVRAWLDANPQYWTRAAREQL